MGHVQDYLVSNTSEFSDMIDKEQALLDVMKGQVVVVQLSEPKDEEEEYKNNCTILNFDCRRNDLSEYGKSQL